MRKRPPASEMPTLNYFVQSSIVRQDDTLYCEREMARVILMKEDLHVKQNITSVRWVRPRRQGIKRNTLTSADVLSSRHSSHPSSSVQSRQEETSPLHPSVTMTITWLNNPITWLNNPEFNNVIDQSSYTITHNPFTQPQN
jgi:hypothetical protein